MNIGERIINEAEKQGLNQKQLAVGLGISETSVGKWKIKNQDIKFQNVVKASEFLNVSLDYLAYGMENTSLSPTEKELLHSFRKLSTNDQQRIIGRCEELVSSKNEGQTQGCGEN
nr:MAG TPA: transcriptional repressor DicA [Caudoviricetes sp.]